MQQTTENRRLTYGMSMMIRTMNTTRKVFLLEFGSFRSTAFAGRKHGNCVEVFEMVTSLTLTVTAWLEYTQDGHIGVECDGFQGMMTLDFFCFERKGKSG